MVSNDPPSFNLPFSFSKIVLSSSEESSNDSDEESNAEDSNVTLANAPNLVLKDGGDVTANDQNSWVNVVPTTHDQAVRDRNKNLRQIFEEAGLNYGKDVSAAELKSRMSSAVKLRQASVAKMFKVLNESRDVQLCFLVDVTGSMRKHIDGVRDSIFKIVEKLTEKHGSVKKKVSLAFVGYRDFGYVERFEQLDFTENVENFRQFCSTIQTAEPKSGAKNDMPEDVVGGLVMAVCGQSWSDSMCTKIIFHIADQPCHGKKYHTSDYPFSDRFPDGGPGSITAEDLFNDLPEKGIQYHFGKITSYTDKMIELFSEAMGSEIEVFDIEKVDSLVDSVVSSVSTSINLAMRPNLPAVKIDKSIPNWSTLPIFKGLFLSYEMPETVLEIIGSIPMEQKYPTKAKIQIAEHPFAHGAERKIFCGRDLSSNTTTDIVLKEYIGLANRNSAVPYEIATQMQTIAAYLASIFNVCLVEKTGTTHDINFLKVQVLLIEVKPGENRYLSCERRYGSDCKFLRFSNNVDYEMLESTCKINDLNFEVVELLMAFSHWTYQVSRGYFMVVDLQGIKSTDENGRTILELTDPAIHCKDLTRFGRTNMGPKGMKIFFARHKCNLFCQTMELKKHETTS